MRIVFMGTPQAAVPSLERLIADGHEVVAVYTQPDRPSGRGNKVSYSPVKQLAIGRGLGIYQPEKMRARETLDTFRAHDADAAVVVAFGRILPETFLNAFPHGAINVHFSLLPKYRGAAPVNWAIVNGETETGVTTIQMAAGMDTGPILMQRKTSIAGAENSVALIHRLSGIGAELLSETLANFDRITPVKQENGAATAAPLMSRDDGLVDWSMPAGEIANRVRGFQPFPTAFTYSRGARLTLWQASVAAGELTGESGAILEAHGDNFLIACGGGTALRVEELQPEGKRKMAVRDFLNGAKLKAGDFLGK